MITLLIEGNGNDYLGLVILILTIMLLPAIILASVGFSLKKRKPKTAKILFIIAVVYVVVGLGICGAMTK